MSFSKPRETGPRNPSKQYLEWKAANDQGYFQYYDKNIEDKKARNIRVDLQDFIILDKDLFSITGYDESLDANIGSNEVRSVDDTLIVKRWKDGKATIILQGTYSALKDTIKNMGLNYTRCVYILWNNDIYHIKLSGTGFSGWLNDVESHAKHAARLISCTGFKEGKKGRVEYRVPTFSVHEEELTEDQIEAATQADTVVQEYLTKYLGANGGATKASDASAPPMEETVDTKQWREVVTPGGQRMGALSINELRELQEHLATSGAKGAMLDCVGQAIFDYQKVAKIWDQQVSPTGRKLVDYTIEELEEILGKIKYNHSSKQLIEAALEAKKMAEGSHQVDEEDDDVPF